MTACYHKPFLSIACFTTGFFVVCLSTQPLGALGRPATSDEVPSHAEQQAMLSAIREYAGDYISRLPNFICTQDTRQFEAGRKATHWRKGDTLRFKLVFNGGSEERSIELVNSQPPGPGRRWRAPLTTEGEFGTLLGSVFGASSETSFQWHGWESLNGKRLAVFDYAVDRAHSTMKLSFSDLAHAVVSYHGSVYADAETGKVWRITNSLSDIPPEIHTRSMSTVIEYGEIPIGGAQYLLPVEASVVVDTGSSNIRNEIGFSQYRKFEADSRITFTPEGQSESLKPTPPQ